MEKKYWEKYTEKIKGLLKKIHNTIWVRWITVIVLIIVLLISNIYHYHKVKELRAQVWWEIFSITTKDYGHNDLFDGDVNKFFQQQWEELDQWRLRQKKLMKKYEELLDSYKKWWEISQTNIIEKTYQKTISDAKHHFSYNIQRINNQFQGTITSSDDKYIQSVFLKLKKFDISVSIKKDTITISWDAKYLDNVLKILE